MRAAAGFVLINGWLVAVGASVLRALGVRLRGGAPALVALGPGLLAGAVTVVPLLIAALVVGIALTPLTVVGAGAIVIVLARLARRRGGTQAGCPPGRAGGLRWTIAAVSLAFGLLGAVAFARAPTTGDDARIWSLRGLTLIDFHRLVPEIFLSRTQSLGHPVYPLFQPVLEAIVAEAMGSPQLRIAHSELWMLAVCALWTAALVLAGRPGAASRRRPYWLAPLALVALTPFVRHNVYIGDADVTGAALLAVALAAFAVFLESDRGRWLALGALVLAAAASTKDEEYLAAIPVLIVLLVAMPARRWAPFGAAAFVACTVAPWRIWVAAHSLTDPVEPHLPRALSPIWLLQRGDLATVAHAMLRQVLGQWGWLGPAFLITCLVCLATRTAVRVTLFYLGSVLGTAAVLGWVYLATPQPLGYLIPTSMGRTVGAFMLPAGIATAHLLAVLLDAAAAPAIARRTELSRGAARWAWWRSSRTASPRSHG